MSDTFATRTFSFNGQSVDRGEDLSKRDPKIPEQQLNDFRHAGLVGAKPTDAKADAAETKADAGTDGKTKA